VSFLKNLFGPPDIPKLKQEGNVGGLLKLLGHTDWHVRRDAAVALAALGDPRGVDALCVALDSQEPKARQAAATALAELRDRRAAQPLVLTYQKELAQPETDAEVRAALESALLMFHSKEEVEGFRGEALVPYYLSQLGDEKANRGAAWSLGELGDPRAIQPLIGLLGNKDCFLRREVAVALGKLGDRRGVAPLLDLLKDNDPGLLVTEGMGKLFLEWDKPSAVVAAKTHLRSLIEDFVLPSLLAEKWIYFTYSARQAAEEALGKLGDPRAVELLLGLLGDKYWDIRATAAEALGKLADARAVEPLLPLLKDDHFMVRRAAAEALGRLGDTRALAALMTALEDNGGFVVTRGRAESLGPKGDLAWVRMFGEVFPLSTWRDRDLTVRGAAVEALRRLGAQVG